jgi:hypothetical protein
MENDPPINREKKGLGWLQVLGIVVVAMLITIAVTLWLVKVYLFPSEFTPVTLNESEQRVLDRKLQYLDQTASPAGGSAGTEARPLEPQPYSEEGASREVRFSERELNGLIANNTDLARKVAIDLSDDLVSAVILMPMEPDFPIMGGKTLRVRTGVMFAYENERPIVKLRGVSVMGVPLPNAWLGGLKNIDLVQEFGSDEGFWKAFADGVGMIRVEDGNLMIRFKE